MLSVEPQEAGERGDEEEELRRRVAKRQRDYCTESQGSTARYATPCQSSGDMLPNEGEHGTETDRQTDRQTVVPERLKFRFKKKPTNEFGQSL